MMDMRLRALRITSAMFLRLICDVISRFLIACFSLSIISVITSKSSSSPSSSSDSSSASYSFLCCFIFLSLWSQMTICVSFTSRLTLFLNFFNSASFFKTKELVCVQPFAICFIQFGIDQLLMFFYTAIKLATSVADRPVKHYDLYRPRLMKRCYIKPV